MAENRSAPILSAYSRFQIYELLSKTNATILLMARTVFLPQDQEIYGTRQWFCGSWWHWFWGPAEVAREIDDIQLLICNIVCFKGFFIEVNNSGLTWWRIGSVRSSITQASQLARVKPSFPGPSIWVWVWSTRPRRSTRSGGDRWLCL